MSLDQAKLIRLRRERELIGGGEAVRAEEQTLPELDRPVAEAPRRATPVAPAPTRSRPRVLVVDDSSFVRYSLTKLLSAHGYDVVEAADGAAAAELYATARPAAVLLDITMPKMDGLDALRLIRRLDPSARVAMVTGMGQQAIVLEAIKNGAADFIVKPINQERVLTAVQKLTA
jgi:two-component system chemotaxis response regulator CheY